MPVELLPFAPAYCIVGAYRLCTDPHLYNPIWQRSQKSLKRALVLCVPLALVSFPLTRLYTTYVLSRSPLSPKNIHDAALFGVSPVTYTTWMLVLGQVTMLVEWMLSRELKKSRAEVYDQTVKSRGKPDDFWQPYHEEWKVPPLERASRSSERQSFYQKLSTPLFRIIVLRGKSLERRFDDPTVLLTPLSFVPGLSLCVMSSIRSLTLARSLHKPYFAAKKMSPYQVDLWVVERQKEYRMFGFVASLMERIPLVGIVFSISNRIGSAMWAFDLEKRQHEFKSGHLVPTKVYESKTARIASMQASSGIPDEVVHGIGGYPGTKGPVKIKEDGSEIGKPVDEKDGIVAGTGGPELRQRKVPPPPPLPPRA